MPDMKTLTVNDVTYDIRDASAINFKRVLTADDDMDTITTDGVYVYSTSSAPNNAPFENAAVVFVFGNNSTTSQKIQIGFRYGIGGFGRFRALYDSAWHAWSEFATTDQLTSAITEVNTLISNTAGYELLWENASKTSSFATQTLTVSTVGYDHLVVVCSYNRSMVSGQTANRVWLRTKGTGNTTTCLTVDYFYDSEKSIIRPFRKMTVASDRASITFDGGYKYTDTASDENCIPYYIYGVKGVSNP